MVDRLVCGGLLNITIRTLLEEPIKCVDWDNVIRRLSHIFTSVDTFIMHKLFYFTLTYRRTRYVSNFIY